MEKINVAELLKDCPKGMELDCAIYENLYFDSLNADYYGTINCYTLIDGIKTSINFTKYGTFNNHLGAKCVIFPKGKTTWKGFYRPFEDGDIVAYDNPHRDNLQVFIFKDKKENNTLSSCYLMLDGDELDLEEGMYYITRLATEEEKQKLFDAIKENGYHWNEETKSLERLIGPYFHEGDWITCEELNTAKILSINMDRYEVEFIDGNKAFPHIDYIDRNFHLWTIQDAKDGDVLAAYECLVLFKKLDGLNIKCYCNYHFMGHQSFYVDTLQNRDAFHPATKEQRDLLFQKMKEAGYKWNPETKTLEKLIEPKFKVGDRIKHKEKTRWVCTIARVKDRYYVDGHPMCFTLPFGKQDDYELVPNKFDITTLKPFDKVLVRDHNAQEWVASLFSNYNEPKKYKYICVNGSGYAQCIPYEGNEHLLGTTDNCDDYHKTWE